MLGSISSIAECSRTSHLYLGTLEPSAISNSSHVPLDVLFIRLLSAHDLEACGMFVFLASPRQRPFKLVEVLRDLYF